VDTPFINYQPWPAIPALVRAISFTPSPDTLEQFRNRQLTIRTEFDNDSIDASSYWAIFRSLDPSIVAVSKATIKRSSRFMG